MPKRDPETGQFIKADDDLTYRDFEVQSIQHVYGVAGGEDADVENAWDYEPAGGLDRDEIAELVMFQSRGIFAFGDVGGGGADTNIAPNAVHTIFELSTSPETKLVTGHAPAESETDINGTALDMTGSRQSTSPEILWFNYNHNWTPWDNTAAGTGGGGSMHMDHGHIDFREKFGQGPLMDRHDDLFEHISIHNGSVDNPAFLYVNYALFWRIYEDVGVDVTLGD